MKHHKGHTGKIRHGDMTSHVHGHGSHDPLAHSSHKAANKEHGMPHGLSPAPSDMGDMDADDKGMSGNCSYE